MSGVEILFNGCPIICPSKKKTCVEFSTSEEKHFLLSEGEKEYKWMSCILQEWGCHSALHVPIFEEIEVPLKWDTSEKRGEPFDLRYHFVKGLLISEEISFRYFTISDITEDIFTKALQQDRFVDLSYLLMYRCKDSVTQ